ncbi:hypothetical protein [Mycoplasmopsis primatum]|uniref:hypothetical protein n=1 Tax=Mycoplasmopsis primatum TaxID=55604 RepID=UPI0004958347|nr:hypothetical protein [Mycoplasmopsis primatum]
MINIFFSCGEFDEVKKINKTLNCFWKINKKIYKKNKSFRSFLQLINYVPIIQLKNHDHINKIKTVYDICTVTLDNDDEIVPKINGISTIKYNYFNLDNYKDHLEKLANSLKKSLLLNITPIIDLSSDNFINQKFFQICQNIGIPVHVMIFSSVENINLSSDFKFFTRYFNKAKYLDTLKVEFKPIEFWMISNPINCQEAVNKIIEFVKNNFEDFCNKNF